MMGRHSILTVLSIVAVIVPEVAVASEKSPQEASLDARVEAWRKDLAKEFENWICLAQGHPYGRVAAVLGLPPLEKWRRIKKDLSGSITRRPGNLYADDAAIAIAIGVANVEDNSAEAIRRLRTIVKRYPKHGTVLDRYSRHRLAQPDPIWWAAVCGAMPLSFDANGFATKADETRLKRLRHFPSGFRDISRFVYVEHLQKHPKSTRNLAKLTIAHIMLREGGVTRAMKELESLVNSYQDIERIHAEDRKAAAKPEGYYVSQIQRPAVLAVRYYLHACISQDLVDKGISFGTKNVSRISSDGWYWELNEKLGDLYRAKSSKDSAPLAAHQYLVAIKGYLASVERDAKFAMACGDAYTSLPTRKWKTKIAELKKKVKSVGGKVDLKDELEGIKAIFVKKQEPLPQGLSKAAVSARLRSIHSDKEKYPGSKERIRAVAELKVWFLSEAKKVGAEEKSKVIETRRSLSLGLVYLAMYEPDAVAKKAILSCAGSLISYRAPKDGSNREKLGELRQTVNGLVQKMAEAKGENKDATIDALRKELLKLPDDSLEFVAEHLADPELPLDVKIPISDALWNRPCPRAYESFLKVIETNTKSRIVRAAISGIKNALKYSIIGENGIMTGLSGDSI